MEIVSSQTRQALMDANVTNLLARVVGSATNQNYALPLHSDGFMTFTDGNTIAVYNPRDQMVWGTYWFPAAVAPDPVVYLSGLYPDPAGTIADKLWDLAGAPTAKFTLNGWEDVMYAESVKSQLSEVDHGGIIPVLNFKHRLCYMRLSFYKESDSTPITLTKVVLSKVKGSDVRTVININLNAASKEVSYTASGAATTLPCYKIGTEKTEYKGADANYTVEHAEPTAYQAYVLAPHTTGDSANDYTFTITYVMGTSTDRSVNVDLKTAGGSEYGATDSSAGLAYDITFRFTGGEVKAKATIVAWPTAITVATTDVS
jgi:hypothetical protein